MTSIIVPIYFEGERERNKRMKGTTLAPTATKATEEKGKGKGEELKNKGAWCWQ